MEKIKGYVMGAAKIAILLIILNAILELAGATAKAIVYNPIATIKGLTGGGGK